SGAFTSSRLPETACRTLGISRDGSLVRNTVPSYPGILKTSPTSLQYLLFRWIQDFALCGMLDTFFTVPVRRKRMKRHNNRHSGRTREVWPKWSNDFLRRKMLTVALQAIATAPRSQAVHETRTSSWLPVLGARKGRGNIDFRRLRRRPITPFSR